MQEPGKIQVELQEWMGSDQSVANAAWVSTYDKEKREEKYDSSEKVEKIVRGLIQDGHTTPLESVVLRFWLRLPVFSDRQHMTHRVGSHNGLSGRYRTLPEDWLPLPQDCLNIFEKVGCREEAEKKYSSICGSSVKTYRDWLLELKEKERSGILTNAEFKRLREVVRGITPVALMTERTSIFNLHSFANYQRLRNSSHAQPEIRQVARLMLREVIKANVAPIAIDELMKQGWTLAKANFQFSIAGEGE